MMTAAAKRPQQLGLSPSIIHERHRAYARLEKNGVKESNYQGKRCQSVKTRGRWRVMTAQARHDRSEGMGREWPTNFEL